ncbi:MAG: SH3 domain-containing protein, partial [Polyangiaceae bacterium]|nr:SH3 domain-containing protein [Polyangiaceae bacterium]
MNRARPGTLAARGLVTLVAVGALAAASVELASSGAQTGTAGPHAPRSTDGASGHGSQAQGETTTVVAQSELGVPVHPAPRSPKVHARLPDGARVEVLEQRFDGQWLRVRTTSGVRGWIVRRYAASEVGGTLAVRTSVQADQAFLSPEQCRSALHTIRASPRLRQTARVGSYNLRWFPDGRPGHGGGKANKDLDWLACAIASLDVDVL